MTAEHALPLAAGTRLGPYEIVGKIGAGGMGEVFRAHDAKLGRPVAIKILPPEVASDPDRLARFDREAHILAGLNHPAILTIHDVGVADGITSDDRRMVAVLPPWARDALAPGHARIE
jgi:serine/threonine protein kinase